MFFFWWVLFLLLVALFVAIVPVWSYSRRWGYSPTALALLVLLGFLALTYIGSIGPWRPPGPPFHTHETPGAAHPGTPD
jgi:hypothetical protein